MTFVPPSNSASPAVKAGDLPVVARTEALFIEVANFVGDELFKSTVERMSRELDSLRPYEALLIPDQEAEYAALSAAWQARDFSELNRLVMAYFKRRRDLLPQVFALQGRPN